MSPTAHVNDTMQFETCGETQTTDVQEDSLRLCSRGQDLPPLTVTFGHCLSLQLKSG